MEPVLRHRWSQGVPTEPFETLSVVGGDPHAGIEVESLLARVTAPESGHRVLAKLVLDWHRPAGTCALARSGAERERPLHGRPRHTGQHRRVLCPLVRRAGPLVAVAQAPAFEQTPDARHDRGEHIRDIRRREQRRRTEAYVGTVSGKHSVDDERVTMNIQIHRPAEALDDRDGTAPAVHDPSQVSHVAQETEHGPNGNTHDGATQVVIPRQPIAQAMRKRQDPLPHRHRREHVVHHVRGAFRHPSPAAARAGRPPFARKRDEPIQPTVITAKTRKAARQAPASQ